MDSFDPLVSLLLIFSSFLLLLFFSLAEEHIRTNTRRRLEPEARDDRSYRWLNALYAYGNAAVASAYLGKCIAVVMSAICTLQFILFYTGSTLFLVISAIPVGILLFLISTSISRALQKPFNRWGSVIKPMLLWTGWLLLAIPARIMLRLKPSATGTTEQPEEKQVEKEVEPEVQLFKNAMDFSKVKARDCMVPRNEIVSVNMDDSISHLHKLFIDTHFSKILVSKDSSDNFIGYVHSHDMFRQPSEIRNIILPIFMVPENMNARDVFSQFVKQKRSVAVVVDEFGGTAGMLTIEDVIEEIFGEIDDEHDVPELREEQLGENEFLFAGRLEIDYLNGKYQFDLPESDEYDTLAGLVINHLDDIPEPQTVLVVGDYELKVLKMQDARIEIVKVLRKDRA